MGPERAAPLVERLGREHVAMVWRAMRRRLGDAELAHDATQDVFVEVTRSYDRFDPERGSFEGWLLGFVEYTARRARRLEMRCPEPRDDLVEIADDPEPLPGLPEEMVSAVNALPVRDRKLLILRGVEQWPAAAVGELLGMSATNVNTAFARVCARLAKRLEPPYVA